MRTVDEGTKVNNASLYLANTTIVWWRRRYVDMEKGLCTIATLTDFKKELKKQFYLENVAMEVRAKLRRLT